MTKPARKRSGSERLEHLVDQVQPDEVLPDDLPRIDEPDEIPQTAATRELDPTIEGVTPAPDGGVSQHPIHDEDLEDLGPDDYQRQVDEVEDVRLRRDAAADAGLDVEVRPKGPGRKA